MPLETAHQRRPTHLEAKQAVNQPVWYRRNRERSERFARVIDDDDAPGTQEFTSELAVVSALRTLGAEEGADQHARRRMRERVLEAGAQDGSVSDAETGSPATPAGTRAGRPRRPRVSTMLAAAVAAVFALAFAGADLAEDALPGEMLYEVKRSTEALALETAVGDSARGAKHLELASARVAELESLAADRDVAREPSVHRDLLTNLEAHATAGSQLVTTTATRSGGDRLEALGDWAAGHADRMRDIDNAVPTQVRPHARAGIELLTAIEDRAKALAERMTCYPITTGRTDELGAVPAKGSCESSATPSPSPQEAGRESGSATPGGQTTSGTEPGTDEGPAEAGTRSGTPRVEGPVDTPGAPATTDEPSAPGTGVDVPDSPQAPAPRTSAGTGLSGDTELPDPEPDELGTDLSDGSG